MCLGRYSFDEAKKAGIIADYITQEEYEKRRKTGSGFGPVPIDKHGLIWNDNLVLVNLFKCYHLFKRTEWWEREGRFIPTSELSG